LTFVKLAREILPPDSIAVTAGEEVEEGLANILTDKQRQALKAAVSAGWFEIPRRISLKELSELTGISKSTLGEHLEKATSITMKWLVGSQQV
jgi:predicted DNA binding protein